MFDLNHPFFRPLWRRIVILVALLGWAAFEAVQGAYLWAFAFLALGLHCGWGFFISFEPRDKP